MYGYGFYNSFKPSVGAVVFDPDAQAFITAASITDATQQGAVNQLVLDLKSASIWTKMKAVYPFVGGSASSHKYNLKDPRDLDAAFRLTFAGGWTHNANGITGNGSTSYGNTHLVAASVLTNNSTHLSAYVRNNSGTGFDFGAFLGDNKSFRYTIYEANTYSFSDQYDDTTGRVMWNPQTDGTSVGFWTATRNASNSHKIYRNATVKASNTNSSIKNISDITLEMYIGCQLSGVGNPLNYSSRNYSFMSIGDGFSDAEVTALNTIITTYQTTLSRNV
jgi:hypothetical protein